MIKSLKSGFTLAEVLTTLMVIGVVAAMTIPTLMNSTQGQQAKVAAKKAASVLSQATQLMVAKELDCKVTLDQTAGPSGQLASCFSDVMTGTVNDNGLTTPDGMVYYFYSPALTTGSYQLGTICGESLTPTGVGNCAVVVDTNGTSKGTTGTPTTTYSVNELTAITDATDVINFYISGNGAKAAVVGDKNNYGYEYLYGHKYTKNEDGAVTCYKCTTTPVGEGEDAHDTCVCEAHQFAKGTSCSDTDYPESNNNKASLESGCGN